MAKKLTEQEVIKRINEKFPNKFNFSQWEYQGLQNKVTLICNDCKNICITTPAILLAKKTKYGCKQCSRNIRKFTPEQVIKTLKQKYGENRFDFSKFQYKDAKSNITLICNICGTEFSINAYDILRSDKKAINEPCPKCYRKSLSKPQNQFIKELIEKFGNKFDYSKVEYVNAKTKIILICNDCGCEFKVTPDNILRSKIGCPKCAEISRRKAKTYTTEKFISLSKRIHGDKYDYSKTKYIRSDIPIIIVCPKHGEFSQFPSDHLHGSECPKCKTSRGEIFISDYLKELGILYISQYYIPHQDFKRGIFVDFMIESESNHCFIEYNGIQHYQPIEYFSGKEKYYNYQIPRDNALKKYCLENNIPLLEIKYSMKDIEIRQAIIKFLSDNGFYTSRENKP